MRCVGVVCGRDEGDVRVEFGEGVDGGGIGGGRGEGVV